MFLSFSLLPLGASYRAVVHLRVGGALQQLQLFLKELSDRLVDQLVLFLEGYGGGGEREREKAEPLTRFYTAERSTQFKRHRSSNLCGFWESMLTKNPQCAGIEESLVCVFKVFPVLKNKPLSARQSVAGSSFLGSTGKH